MTFSFTRILGFYLLLLPMFMRETRSVVRSIRMAKRSRTETGNTRYRARVEDERTSPRTLIYIFCARPICAPHFIAIFLCPTDWFHSSYVDRDGRRMFLRAFDMIISPRKTLT